jgi:hypothetical protein
MKKIIFTTIAALVLLLFTAGIAFGNAFTLQAENGKILAPAGLGIELNGAYQSGQNTSPLYDAQLSYGITPAITVSGEFTGDFKSGSGNQTLLKVLFSPTREGNGYTLYTDYDVNQSKIPFYGISLWADSKFLYTYANLEARNDSQTEKTSLFLTPGVNLKIGSRIELGGEAEFNAADWNSQELRVGINYNLNSKVTGKFTFKTGLENNPERIYQTGIVVEI